MNRLYFFLILCLTVELTSCYKYEKEVFVEVKKPRSIFEVDSSIEEDSIYIYNLTSINYSINVISESVADVYVTINDRNVSVSFSDDFIVFEVDPLDYGTGYFSMEIAIYLKTGTGSLADNASAEFVEILDSKILHIDIDPPTNALVANFLIEDGKSIIKWNRANKENIIQTNILIKNRFTDDWDTIKDLNVSQFHDNLYAGGEITYKVAWQGYDFYIESDEVIVNERTIKDFILTVNEQNHVKISSPLLRFYNNIINVLISTKGLQEKKYSIDRNFSFTHSSPLYFGEVRNYEFRMNSNVSNSRHYDYIDNTEAYLGSRINSYHKSFYFKSKQVLILTKRITDYTNGYKQYTNIYKYDFQTMELVDSIRLDIPHSLQLSFLSSENGEHFYLFYKDKIEKLNIDNMELTFYAIRSDLLLGNTEEHYIGFVSNNNLISFRDQSKWIVTDASSRLVIFEHVIDYLTTPQNEPVNFTPMISNDGNYVYTIEKRSATSSGYSGVIYQRNGVGFTRKGYTSKLLYTRTVNFFFDGISTKIIGSNYFNRIYYTYDIDNLPNGSNYFTLTNTSPLIDLNYSSGYHYYDGASHSVFGTADSKEFVVYDADNWQIKSQTQISPFIQLEYYDSKILSYEGLYLKKE